RPLLAAASNFPSGLKVKVLPCSFPSAVNTSRPVTSQALTRPAPEAARSLPSGLKTTPPKDWSFDQGSERTSFRVVASQSFTDQPWSLSSPVVASNLPSGLNVKPENVLLWDWRLTEGPFPSGCHVSMSHTFTWAGMPCGPLAYAARRRPSGLSGLSLPHPQVASSRPLAMSQSRVLPLALRPGPHRTAPSRPSPTKARWAHVRFVSMVRTSRPVAASHTRIPSLQPAASQRPSGLYATGPFPPDWPGSFWPLTTSQR